MPNKKIPDSVLGRTIGRATETLRRQYKPVNSENLTKTVKSYGYSVNSRRIERVAKELQIGMKD